MKIPGGDNFLPADGISAVVLNITVTGSTGTGYVTAYPSGKARPTASSLNYTKGWTGANSVTVAVGSGNGVDIYSSAGHPQLIVDIVGIYASSDALRYEDCNYATCGVGGQYQPAKLQRILDTRTFLKAQLPAGYFIQIPVNYGAAINSHIRALAINVTSTGSKASGFLTSWPGNNGDLLPNASTLNFPKGRTVPNMAIVPVAACEGCGAATGLPTISIYTSAKTDVIVDVVGIFDDGTLADGYRFTPITPHRIVDSHSKVGTTGALGAGKTATITTPASVLGSATGALAINLTAVSPTVSTWLTVWPAGSTRPSVSTLNPVAKQTVPNAAIALLGTGDAFNVFNAAGSTNFLVDVVGRYDLYPGTASSSSKVRANSSIPRLSGTAPTPVVHQR